MVSALLSQSLDLNIIIVDDNSPDGTGSIADSLAGKYSGKIKVLHRAEKSGLRTAYLEGFAIACGMNIDAIVQMDADFSHDPSVLPKMVSILSEGSDLVIGSRYVKGGSLSESWPTWRKALSAFGNIYARFILNFPLRDVTTGYRMWRKAALETIPLDRIISNGYIFLVEMAYLAYMLRLNIVETPIHFSDRRLGNSKMSLSIQLEAAFRLWELRWHYRDLRRKPSVPENG